MTADGHFEVPRPTNESVRQYAPGDVHRKSLKARLAELTDARTEVPMQIGGERRWGWVAGRHQIPSPPGAGHRRVRRRRRRRTSTTRSTPPSRRAGCGRPPRTTSGPRSCSARRRCWPDRGGTRSTRRPCSASRRPFTRPRSTPLARQSTSGATTPISATSCCASSPPTTGPPGTASSIGRSRDSSSRSARSTSPRSARNLPTAPMLMGNTVVFKPATQTLLVSHFLMEILNEAGMPPGVINMVSGSASEISEQGAEASRPGRDSFHRLDGGLPGHVERRWARTSTATGPIRDWSERRAARTS